MTDIDIVVLEEGAVEVFDAVVGHARITHPHHGVRITISSFDEVLHDHARKAGFQEIEIFRTGVREFVIYRLDSGP